MSPVASQDQATRFASHMIRSFSGFLITESQLSGAISTLIPIDPTKLVNLGSITIPPVVYLSDRLTPDEQIETIVKASSLLNQFWEEPFAFMHLFVGSSEARAAYVARARVSMLEVSFARTRSIPPLDALVDPLLHGYGLNAGDLRLARGIIEVAATSIQNDLVFTKAGRVGITWLRDHAPELLAAVV